MTAAGEETSERAALNKSRWPANLVLDEEAGAMLDEQSGSSKSGVRVGGEGEPYDPSQDSWRFRRAAGGFADSGGASRFFKRFHYSAKASRSEREAGLRGHLPCVKCGDIDSESHEDERGQTVKCVRNSHPTVKPLSLMRYLVRLITPPDGVVLDPFCGSGSTLVAALQEGFGFIGVDKDEQACEVAKYRVLGASSEKEESNASL